MVDNISGICLKCRSLPQPSTELEDDEDVAEERERILSGDADDDLIVLKNLTKVKRDKTTWRLPIVKFPKNFPIVLQVYFSKKTGNHLAVDRLCLGIQQGEVCSGLVRSISLQNEAS